jgi:hypothetical protein
LESELAVSTPGSTLAEDSPWSFVEFDAESSPHAQIIANAPTATIVLNSLFFIKPLFLRQPKPWQFTT